ncbi:hypothetical protein DAI22_03g395100 [Oryza sativa Japonica Group]|nr:uncharacterized protein LOC4334609 isoform X1 [Oryza sativa Japonica Group]KAF2942072.1 hypothetical protein DAI22_03g395100 [Oryza sativa Japonica Group]
MEIETKTKATSSRGGGFGKHREGRGGSRGRGRARACQECARRGRWPRHALLASSGPANKLLGFHLCVGPRRRAKTLAIPSASVVFTFATVTAAAAGRRGSHERRGRHRRLLLPRGAAPRLRRPLRVQADPDTEAAQAHRPRRRRPRPRLRPRRVAPGDVGSPPLLSSARFRFSSVLHCVGGVPEPGSAREGRGDRRRRCQEQKVKVPSAHCDSRVRTVCADVMALMKQQARAMSPQERGFSVILSDMCPVVSGITTKDAAISCELGMRALSLAVGKMKAKDSDCIAILEKFQSSTEPDPDEDGILRRGGSLVIKFLENEDIPGFGKFCKEKFKKVSLLRPKATRSSSREIFMVCEGLR